MRCHRPNTDQELEISVFANGVQCDEYELHSSSNSDPNVLECFVPVCEGDQLTFSGAFTGSVLHACFDVLADGSYLCDKRIEGPKTGVLKYYKKRKVDVKTVFDSLAKDAFFGEKKIVEGNLHVKAMREEYEGSPLNVDAKALGVGSLTLICSLNQDTTENYEQAYPSPTCGDWALRGQEDVTDGGIKPTFEVEVKVTDDDVSKSRQLKHKRHFGQTRFGLKPWAKFIFHYRTQAAIDEADCVERDDESQALEPADEDTFVRASTETPKKVTTRSKRKAVDIEEDEITVASGRPAKDPSGDLFVTPPPASRTPPAREEWQLHTSPAPEPPKKTAVSVQVVQESPLVKRQKVARQISNTTMSAAPLLQTQQDAETAPHDNARTVPREIWQEQESGGGGLEHITPFSEFNKMLEQQEAAVSKDPLAFLRSPPQAAAAPVAQMVAPVAEMVPAPSEAHIVAQTAQDLFTSSRSTYQELGRHYRTREINQAAPVQSVVSAPEVLTDVVAPAVTAQALVQIDEYTGPSTLVPVAQALPASSETKNVNVEQTQGVEPGPSVHVKEEDASAPSFQDTHNKDNATANVALHLDIPTNSDSHINAFTTSPSPLLTTLMTSPPPSLSHATIASPRLSQTYPDDASLSPCKLTPERIALSIPPQGIKVTRLKECFTEEELPSNKRARVQFVQMLKMVARNVDEVYYLKSGSPTQSRSQRTVTPAAVEQKVEVVADTKTPKIEELDTDHKEHTPAQSDLALRGNPTPPRSTTSQKRNASVMAASTESRGSTPASSSNKKARPNALSSKKAELLAAIEAKKQKKAAAQKALQEQQDLRAKEEQLREQAEMREIEMLEAMAKVEDDELEALEQQRAEEVEGWEEARRAREVAEESIRAGSEEV